MDMIQCVSYFSSTVTSCCNICFYLFMQNIDLCIPSFIHPPYLLAPWEGKVTGKEKKLLDIAQEKWCSSYQAAIGIAASCVVLIACFWIAFVSVLHDSIWAVEPTGFLLALWIFVLLVSGWNFHVAGLVHFCVLPLHGYRVLDDSSGWKIWVFRQ